MSRIETRKTTVRLLSFTKNIPETIYVEWIASRTDGPVPTPEEVRLQIAKERLAAAGPDSEASPEFQGVPPGKFETEVQKIFEDCVDMKVPIAETVGFVFEVDHMPIALREQWVRHRIGHKYNGDFGFEQVPSQHDSSFWSQTFRAKDMGSFATDGEFYEPEWLALWGGKAMEGHGKVYCPSCGEEAAYVPGPEGSYLCLQKSHPPKTFQISPSLTVGHFYREQHLWLQASYRRLVKAGMPLEDARNILPLSCQHRMTWSTNLSALTHILSKRGCWIAQLGMWQPVVEGIVSELVKHVSPYFHKLIDPPCIGSDDKFDACKFHKENKEYIRGTDPHHPCPLWMFHYGEKATDVIDEERRKNYLFEGTWECNSGPDTEAMFFDSDGRWWKPNRPNVTGSVEAERADFKARAVRYEHLWGRDPLTGERTQLV